MKNDFFSGIYDPDILSRLVILSKGKEFTPSRAANIILDLVKSETERIDSRFLEPACGDGDFLAEILQRKLAVVRKIYAKSPADYEKNAIIAVSSIYGVDILQDNVYACQERLFDIWDTEYKAVCKKKVNWDVRKSVRFILSCNILCGNILTLMCVDKNCKDTDKPIIFSEWANITGETFQRCEYRLDVLLDENPEKANYNVQFDIFSDKPSGVENWMLDPIKHMHVPKPLRVISNINYRRIWEYGE